MQSHTLFRTARVCRRSREATLGQARAITRRAGSGAAGTAGHSSRLTRVESRTRLHAISYDGILLVMRVSPRVRAAHALLLHGAATREDQQGRGALLSAAGNLVNTTFRASAKAIGGHQANPGLRFFDGSSNGWISFGPGAGVCIGVSGGARSCRGVLVDANGGKYAGEERDEIDELDEQLAQTPAVVL